MEGDQAESDVYSSVLILDDDATFRALITDILKRRRINVLSARSIREATDIVANGDPLLAIVDYRLGESDGISWITKMRESGRVFPIVFLSGTWCDETTFNCLRNILKVSLILTKPIEPSLFLQQIDALLPVFGTEQNDTWTQRQDHASGIAQTSAPGVETAQPVLDDERKKSRATAKTKDKLSKLRANYAATLAQQWAELSEAIYQAQNAADNQENIDRVVQIAHRIYGTSGSLGFSAVSQSSGKIEALLRGYDPLDRSSDSIWSEVSGALDTGADEVQQAVRAEGAVTTQVATTKVLLVADGEHNENATGYLQTINNLDLDCIESLPAGMQAARKANYDSAVIDLSLGAYDPVLDLCAMLRTKHSIPLGAICRDLGTLTDAEIVYCGISTALKGVAQQAELEKLINQLISLRERRKAKILTVDDDEPLTDFITQILTAHNMSVRALNRPISILQAMQEFKPDLVLLDVWMPGVSGFDVCRMLRASELWGQLPIIFLTARTDEEGRAGAYQAGGTDFLCKPVLCEELVARVRAHIDHARANRGHQPEDPLTGLMTGDELISELGELIGDAAAEEQPLALSLLGIDDFSRLSVEHGWSAAEDILRKMGKLLKCRFRTEDLRARLGQDGFAIVLPGQNKTTAAATLKLLRDEFSTLRFYGESGKTFQASFSAGIAEFPADGGDLQTMLHNANQRLISGQKEKDGAVSSS